MDSVPVRLLLNQPTYAARTFLLCAATVRANSVPVSSKAILQKLPLRVYKRLEEIIAKCSYMEWKHFDAGVIKVGMVRCSWCLYFLNQ